MKLLIDGDLLLYKATTAVEKEIRWDEDNHVLFSNAQEAFQQFSRSIEQIVDTLDCPNIVICFTKGDSFRKELYPTYKQNRVGMRKPLAFSRVREMAEGTWYCLSKPNLEADDVMGILATKNPECVIVSQDKDMKTVPCKLYRDGELVTITQEEADYNWMFQTLTGDATDGYPGCPGIGAVKAEAILKKERDPMRTYWERVVEAYEKVGLTKEDAEIQARLARILRNEDWDASKKEVRLWSPPQKQ